MVNQNPEDSGRSEGTAAVKDRSGQPVRSELTGRTLGDVIDSILEHPQRWASLFLFCVVFSGLVIGVAWTMTKILHLRTSEVRIGSTNSRVVFESVQEGAGKQYVVIVSPQGWQNTEIVVHAGDKVSFQAGGKVCIDLKEIVANVELRRQFEGEVAGSMGIKKNDPNETRVPEDFFNPEQRKKLILDHPWVDPDGFKRNTFVGDFPSRRQKYLLPEMNAGGLIAAIRPGAQEPDKSEAFFVGRQMDNYVAAKDGAIWFTVNDITFSDPDNPNLFFYDNIGTFWVRIDVTPK
jgi:hypothetical protein